jgi:hypothetical protein
MLDQDLGGFEPPALENLAHFGRELRPATRIAALTLFETTFACMVCHPATFLF